MKSKVVYRGSFGNPAGQQFELVGQSCRRHQKECGGSVPFLCKTWVRWVAWEESGESVSLEGPRVLTWAHLLVSEKLPRSLLWIPVAPTLALSSNQSLQMSLFSSPQQYTAGRQGADIGFFGVTHPQPGRQ